MNALRLSAEIVERDASRYTPAGVPVVDFRLLHRSEIVEAGIQRSVEFEVRAVGIGDICQSIVAAPLAVGLTFTGFLAKRSANSKTLVFHVMGIETPDVERIMNR
ncbi:MAG TPA: primosomal replication protein N [Burkholderiaceae bacterium]|nr:primosomal replication protein N [Burkholderiaceae bacterium]